MVAITVIPACFDSKQGFQDAMSMLGNANVLRRTHAETLSGAFREIKACAHAIRNSPRSSVIDPDDNRPAVMGICHSESRSEWPGSRCSGVAARVETFATRRPLS